MLRIVVTVASLAAVAATTLRSLPRVEVEEDAVSLPFLKDLPRPWVLEQVPSPGRRKEPTTRPPSMKEVKVPKYYYPYYYGPPPFNKYRLRTDGSGVAVHPGGATSFVSPQVHGVGKRSTKPSASVVVRRTPVPMLPPYVYDPWRYPYYPRYHPLAYPPPPYPASSFVYHRQTHKRSPLTSESEHGYSYGW